MFAHGYPFDPSYGRNLAELHAIEPPPEAPDFADFWRGLYAQARAVDPAPRLHEVTSPRAETWRLFELGFTSLGARSVGGWLLLPSRGPIERGLIVGHGYGGRDAPTAEEVDDLPPRCAVLLPCARGISRSACADIPSDPMRHVLHGLSSRETSVLAGCAADLVWSAASALIALQPGAARRLDCIGISFSGGIAALALPWDDRFARAHLCVPTFGHHPLRMACPCVGSGEALRHRQAQNPHTLELLRYFDAASAARHLHRPVLVAAALFDPAVPPPGQFAIFNALPGPKTLFVLQAGHFDHPGAADEQARLRQSVADFLAAD